MECLAQVNGEAVPLDPTGHVQQKATLIDQTNTYKQTQGSGQNEETKKSVPNERTEQNSRKRTKQNGNKQSTRCRIQNIGDKDAQ